MVDLGTIIPTLVAGGGMTWVGTVAVQWLKGRGEDSSARVKADAELEKHRDSLTFQLLGAAKAELLTLSADVARLRPMEEHFYHLQQALEHLEALLNADADTRQMVERNARAFLSRMRRLADARGTMLNEVQIARSEASVPPDMRDTLGKLG